MFPLKKFAVSGAGVRGDGFWSGGRWRQVAAGGWPCPSPAPPPFPPFPPPPSDLRGSLLWGRLSWAGAAATPVLKVTSCCCPFCASGWGRVHPSGVPAGLPSAPGSVRGAGKSHHLPRFGKLHESAHAVGKWDPGLGEARRGVLRAERP